MTSAPPVYHSTLHEYCDKKNSTHLTGIVWNHVYTLMHHIVISLGFPSHAAINLFHS